MDVRDSLQHRIVCIWMGKELRQGSTQTVRDNIGGLRTVATEINMSSVIDVGERGLICLTS